MSSLDPLEPGDELAQLFADWRAELDHQANTVMSTDVPALSGRSRRWMRAHQRTAAAAAIVVAIAGSTSVAAAASGSSGPLGGVHDFLYGPPAVRSIDHDAAKAARILATVEARIEQSQQAGSITTSERAQLSIRLDRVRSLLDGDPQAPDDLSTRLASAGDALLAIPAPSPPVADAHHRGHGRDDTPGDDRSGRSGDDRQGNDDGRGDDRVGSQGEDDGNQDGDGGGRDGGDGRDGARSSGGDDRTDDGTDGGSDDGTDGGSDDGGSTPDGNGSDNNASGDD